MDHVEKFDFLGWWWIATRRSLSISQLAQKQLSCLKFIEIFKIDSTETFWNALSSPAILFASQLASLILRSPLRGFRPHSSSIQKGLVAFLCLAPLWSLYGVSGAWQSHDRQMVGCQKWVSIWGRDPRHRVLTISPSRLACFDAPTVSFRMKKMKEGTQNRLWSVGHEIWHCEIKFQSRCHARNYKKDIACNHSNLESLFILYIL